MPYEVSILNLNILKPILQHLSDFLKDLGTWLKGIRPLLSHSMAISNYDIVFGHSLMSHSGGNIGLQKLLSVDSHENLTHMKTTLLDSVNTLRSIQSKGLLPLLVLSL